MHLHLCCFTAQTWTSGWKIVLLLLYLLNFGRVVGTSKQRSFQGPENLGASKFVQNECPKRDLFFLIFCLYVACRHDVYPGVAA